MFLWSLDASESSSLIGGLLEEAKDSSPLFLVSLIGFSLALPIVVAYVITKLRPTSSSSSSSSASSSSATQQSITAASSSTSAAALASLARDIDREAKSVASLRTTVADLSAELQEAE
ncbi:MAG: hypothetical protein Q8P67_15590, partial [archaeon]|nr:hypothetical protein [archaeon]